MLGVDQARCFRRLAMPCCSRILRVFFLSCFCLPFLTAAAFAQFKASMQGTIRDPKGEVVSGAKVSLTAQATGVAHYTASNDQGYYRVNELSPGLYTVVVEASGFKQAVLKNISVDAEQPREVDVLMEIGEVRESVTVTTTPGGLETENANVSSTIGSAEILTLPQFGRDPYELL